MTVFIVSFAIVNLIFSEESRKHALLTYAYDEALKKVGEQCEKKITVTSLKKEGTQCDENTTETSPKTEEKQRDTNTTGTAPNATTKSKKEKIDYGIWAITKIFETYCQNITAK